MDVSAAVIVVAGTILVLACQTIALRGHADRPVDYYDIPQLSARWARLLTEIGAMAIVVGMLGGPLWQAMWRIPLGVGLSFIAWLGPAIVHNLARRLLGPAARS
jgi:hypothetical protein